MTLQRSASSWRRGGKPYTINPEPQPPIFLTAAGLLYRRWPLYLTCVVVATIAQIAVARAVHANAASVFLIGLIAAPLINAVVIVYAGCDLTETMPETAKRVERILDRAWAIIVLDAILSIVQTISYLTIGSGDRGDAVLGIVAFFLSTMLIYSETFAALEPDISPWLLLPFALVRSMMLGWVNVWRICLLFALNVTCLVGGFFVQSAPTRYANDLVFAYYSLMAAVLWVVYTVAYVRTLSEERAVFPG